MARKPELSGDVIAVDLDGKRASWGQGLDAEGNPSTKIPGRFAGDPELVEAAKAAVAAKDLIVWGRMKPHKATDTDAKGALAALMALDAGRTCITVWPEDLREWWETSHSQCGAERLDVQRG